MPTHAHGPPAASDVDFENWEGREAPASSVFKPLLCSGVQMFKMSGIV